jgi:nitronate monooxygenase
MEKTSLTQLLDIKYPIIMAPMFLVTNTKMMIEALNCDIAACVPALNYRTDQELRDAILQIRNQTNSSALGINLIVNKSNIKLAKQLATCVELEVDFIITSLGSPEKVIDVCKPKGIKVFCDVINLYMAKKVQDLNADGITEEVIEFYGYVDPIVDGNATYGYTTLTPTSDL